MVAGQSKVQMWDERTKQDPRVEDKVERGGDGRSDIKSKPMMRRQEAQITGREPGQARWHNDADDPGSIWNDGNRSNRERIREREGERDWKR